MRQKFSMQYWLPPPQHAAKQLMAFVHALCRVLAMKAVELLCQPTLSLPLRLARLAWHSVQTQV
jgi:hypothetical protein